MQVMKPAGNITAQTDFSGSITEKKNEIDKSISK